MIVVADSSPLHYLILIEQAEVLRRLYGEVAIPDVVAAELRAERSPRKVREWLSAPPPWLRVSGVTPEEIASVPETLDLGERAAIALAERIHAELLLIDEAAGRREARQRRLRVTGTLGVLRTGADAGFVDVPDVLTRLESTNFYVDETLLKSIFGRWLESDAEQR
jgi:predicted nucleic acid-binding protein